MNAVYQVKGLIATAVPITALSKDVRVQKLSSRALAPACAYTLWPTEYMARSMLFLAGKRSFAEVEQEDAQQAQEARSHLYLGVHKDQGPNMDPKLRGSVLRTPTKKGTQLMALTAISQLLGL